MAEINGGQTHTTENDYMNGEDASGEDRPEAVDAEKGQETTEGDEGGWTFKRIIAIASLCIVYVGSQVLLYFVSAGLTFIELTLKTQYGNWTLTANTLAVTAICPFVGYVTDLLGRRWVCVFGTFSLIVGSIVMATGTWLGAAVVA